MRRLIRILFPVAALFAAACIENDIPYPTVEVHINGIAGKGFSEPRIDLTNRTATLTLDETTDIQNVEIDEVTFAIDAHNTNIDPQTFLDRIRTSRSLTGTFDLRTPLYVTLSLYQDYAWQIVAEQTVPRIFSVAGQVGESDFDLENRIATAYVAKNADRSRVAITALKLGPEDITVCSPSIEELSTLDYSSPDPDDPTLGTPHFVDVAFHGRTERWVLYVLPTDKTVRTEAVDAWSKTIWLRGTGIEGVDRMGFRYRIGTSGEWFEVPNVQIEGGSFSAAFASQPGTTYQFVSYCGDEETLPETVTTQGVEQLPNSGLEDWSKPGKPWLPFLSEETAYWGSGNNGAVTLGDKYNVTTPDETDLRPGSTGRKSARLESTYVAVKLAAGNLFTGEFAGIRGVTHGVVNFGRPFTLRPTALRLWVKYIRGTITDVSGVPAGMTIQKGDPDNGSIFVALGTWTKEEYGLAKGGELMGTDHSPVSIDTRDVKTFFNPRGKDVIGYGERILTESVAEWQQITIPIDYPDKSLRPTHIMVVCSASRWGDYFTGSRDSKMWLDDFELVYDPLPDSGQ
ncbi:PCMD domain-containing protein [Alistipes sp.]|uniref:PCMD domain-containing protein n=1 Tax=Alistipes sp. TaxID=1872444 RepID=UPI003AEF4196